MCRQLTEFQEACDAHGVQRLKTGRWTRPSMSGQLSSSERLHLVCRLQRGLALSSGEAELCAQSAGIADAFGVRNVVAEFGILMPILATCDSAAARGIANRTRTDQVKHLEFKQLWVQGYVRPKIVKVECVLCKENPADALTHASGEFKEHVSRLMQIFVAGCP